MSRDELLADTNRVLHELLEIEKEQLEKSEQSSKKWEAESAQREANIAARMRELFLEQGLSEEEANCNEEEWNRRLHEAQCKSRLRLEELRLQDERFKELLLGELRVQSDLLRQISERLDR